MTELLQLLSNGDTLAALAVVLVAGAVRGFAGFGTGLIYMPVAAMLFGPRTAAATLLLYDLPAVIPHTIRLLPLANLRDVLPLAVGAALLTPVGALALGSLDPVTVRWVISLSVLAAVGLIASGWRFGREPGRAVAVGVGAASGFLNGLAQIGGPPVILFWLSRATAPVTIRASASLFFLIGTTVTIASYLFAGFFDRRILLLALLMAPVFAIGLWVGSFGFRFASEQIYRRAAFLLITLSALWGLPLWSSLPWK